MKTIILNNQIIQYDLKRNAKRNVNIRIEPDFTLRVSAPRWVLNSEVEKALYDKSKWIISTLEKQKQLQKNGKKIILEDGNTILFRGNEYKLYYKNSTRNFVYTSDDQILVFTKKIEDQQYSQEILKKWLKGIAVIDFNQSLQKYRNMMIKKYNIPEYNLQIRPMKSCWGSCMPARKKVTLNLNLMYAPTELLDCIALHELTHFVEIHHNSHFYGIMSEYMPDYKARQKCLDKEYGQIIRQNYK